MKKIHFSIILLSSLIMVSCGKKDDLSYIKDSDSHSEMHSNVHSEVRSHSDEKDMMLTKKDNISQEIDVVKSYQDEAPTFDSGIRPGRSK